MKLPIRQLAKVPLLGRGLLKQNGTHGIGYLIYHSVAGQLNLELDLPPALFRRQLEFLAQTGRVTSYDEALLSLQSGRPPGSDHFVLTFDDGYENFYSQVFPLLRELKLPATLFVTTGFVETGIPYPIQQRGLEARPVTWEMLGEMAESGLVTIGAHTHTHPTLTEIPEAQVVEELAQPLELFHRRLGLRVRHFSYPKALWNQKIETVVAQYYGSAVICAEKKATLHEFNPYRIPRIPIRRSDGWWFFLAKMHGWLQGEEAMYDQLRFLDRRRHITAS